MRLGEFRTLSREFDNRLKIHLACYDDDKGVRIFNLEFDMSNDNELFFRVVDWLDNDLKIKYIEGLSRDELRYELDKIYARMKEIEMFREIREDMPNDFLKDSLNVLDRDMEKLIFEMGVYESYFKLREWLFFLYGKSMFWEKIYFFFKKTFLYFLCEKNFVIFSLKFFLWGKIGFLSFFSLWGFFIAEEDICFVLLCYKNFFCCLIFL